MRLGRSPAVASSRVVHQSELIPVTGVSRDRPKSLESATGAVVAEHALGSPPVAPRSVPGLAADLDAGLRRLTDVSPDPVWRRLDPEAVRALAALELRSADVARVKPARYNAEGNRHQ